MQLSQLHLAPSFLHQAVTPCISWMIFLWVMPLSALTWNHTSDNWHQNKLSIVWHTSVYFYKMYAMFPSTPALTVVTYLVCLIWGRGNIKSWSVIFILVVRWSLVSVWPGFYLLRELAPPLAKSPFPQPPQFLTRFTVVLQNIDLKSN